MREREWVRERQMEEGMRQEIREIMAEWKRVAEGVNNRMEVTKGERGVRKRVRCRQGH